MASTIAAATKVSRKMFRELHGVVVTSGLIDKTVKVRVGGQKFNKFLQKHFDDPKQYLVHDPNNSLRAGDVVAIMPGFITSKSKRHVVKHIIAPAGTPIEERPPIPSLDELWDAKDAAKAAKKERKVLREKMQAAEEAIELAERMARHAVREIAMREKIISLQKVD
ncbi:hypothetical protein GE21DRAFT_10258 [Neurospora crassa]|uniref:Small ribosomal subunit protein uS17m n=2 Tax=Neurospora crassa TaxID=5141 RepID=RT17_NEUCR|nr:mitochondrial 37S ribosomal protein S17 [Neurospora crassa OR74A]Q7S4E0.1 RecName: Full=Small ribosomal subunit protein uS17m [Neurospora crassa OR74A]6YW5_QQ Chain QQ, Mitochondrial 37S ribosomal protein S17 [Neurospora crassa OR74A]6YWE_QQ Chain QQ, uS17m [Neurospora crassa]6YWX_QQ Chain QQ, Mitochondrial 37S ribosomal protein S17 [Neurospora crassa OR74A]6YWY_QQ Chain QQ, uS17m [Neurospora crassa]EAA30365.1 mitochondrial 37S ribosomal protein S17 [Neurospora crassa OR74A]KHE78698.1 hyp|eukprot:XP_959601.1 mitochondrial 37S ribosomal protein S17 [Neurospora crassa OR74A]